MCRNDNSGSIALLLDWAWLKRFVGLSNYAVAVVTYRITDNIVD